MVDEDLSVPFSSAVLAPLGPDEFLREMTGLAVECSPRRFAIMEELGERDDADVFAWGMAWEDWAVVCADDGTHLMRFRSAGSVMRAFRHVGRLHLIWIDPEVDPQLDSEVDPEVGASRE